jgi:thiamine biosynthesis lipoprotein
MSESGTASCARAAPRTTTLRRVGELWQGSFVAMACPCEVLIEAIEPQQAGAILDAVAECAWRIEAKFSRYRSGNIVDAINTSRGDAVLVDEETAQLIDFAATLTRLSDGRFDITSGVLRRAWTFDGGSRVPDREVVARLLELVGWDRVEWHNPTLRLCPGMQIDFGGIGKEYAVDTAARIAGDIAPGVSCLINFGGDVTVRNVAHDERPWRVGIERVDEPGTAASLVNLRCGGVATSGDARRFVLRNGKRYSHVLDARTGWPVPGAPRSVTVAADSCTQAGSLATLALLHGSEAATFLRAQGVQHWLQAA